MRKSTKHFLLGTSSGIAFIVFLYLLLHCESGDTMVPVYGISMAFTMGLASYGLFAAFEALAKERPEWFEWIKSLRHRLNSSGSSAKTGNSTIWMWLIGLPLLTLFKLIVREPGSKKRHRKW